MTNAEIIATIRNEIERRKNNAETLRERNICIDILSFLDDRFKNGFDEGVEEGKKMMMEDCPKWHKVQRGSCFDKHTNFLLSAREGHFYCSAMEVPRDGYILLVDELERLPKEDEQ